MTLQENCQDSNFCTFSRWPLASILVFRGRDHTSAGLNQPPCLDPSIQGQHCCFHTGAGPALGLKVQDQESTSHRDR